MNYKLILFVIFAILFSSCALSLTWSSSYTYKREIGNITTSDIAVAVNGTTGWEINSSNYIVWTNPSQCGGTMQLYYNNNTDFSVICNDTTIMYYGEEVSGTNYNNNFSGIYNSNIELAYHFGNSTTAAWDTSGNGNNGTVNGATYTSSGKYGGAYDFDGTNDYVNAGTINIPTSHTVCFWINNDDETTNNNPFHHSDGTNKLDFVWFSASGKIRYGLTGGTNLLATNDMVEDEWYFICGSADGTTQRLYINGVLNNTGSQGTWTGGSRTTWIGALTNPVYYWDGGIDDVRIYSEALTSTEIAELYNNSEVLNMQLGEEETEEAGGVINVTLNSPENDSLLLYKDRPFTFNFSVNNTINSTSFNCSLYVNGTLNQTNTSVINDTITDFEPINLSRANWNWSVTCNDTSSEIRTFTVNNSNPQNVNITYPANGDTFVTSTETSTNVAINYTAIDLDGDTLTYYLYVNDTLNQTNSDNTTIDLFGGSYSLRVEAGDGFVNVSSESVNITVNEVNIDITLNPGISLTFLPEEPNSTEVEPSGQSSSLSALNASNNETVNLSLQMAIDYVGYYLNRLITGFENIEGWQVNQTFSTNSSYNFTTVCMTLGYGDYEETNITIVQPHSMGRIVYNFNNTQVNERYNGSDYINQSWSSDCPVTNYIQLNLSYKNVSTNFTGLDTVNLSYYSTSNTSDTIKLSVTDSSGTQVNSTQKTLENQSWNNLSVNISTLTLSGVPTVTVYLINGSTNATDNGIVYIDNLIVFNSSSFSTGLTVKVNCEYNYSTAVTLQQLNTYTDVCTIENKTSTGVWVWNDYDYPNLGLNWDIYYKAGTVS